MEKLSEKGRFIKDADIELDNLGDGISRKVIVYDESLMLVKVIFEKGAVGVVHQHYHTQISYVEKGAFEVNINGEKRVLGIGSSFYVPPNTPHGVYCLEAGVLLDMFSPMREDFIK